MQELLKGVAWRMEWATDNAPGVGKGNRMRAAPLEARKNGPYKSHPSTGCRL